MAYPPPVQGQMGLRGLASLRYAHCEEAGPTRPPYHVTPSSWQESISTVVYTQTVFLLELHVLLLQFIGTRATAPTSPAHYGPAAPFTLSPCPVYFCLYPDLSPTRPTLLLPHPRSTRRAHPKHAP